MKVLQARLGFNFPNGWSSRNRRLFEYPEIAGLHNGITRINTSYSDHTTRQIRASRGFKAKVDELFHSLGSDLWPDIDEGDYWSPAWLLKPSDNDYAKDGDLIRLYPRHLHYSNPLDRER